MAGYDVVIVGGGSAGCVLANRLSASGARVLLVEAGPRDASPFIRMPAGAGKMFTSTHYAWQHDTVPQAGLDGRRIRIPQGRTLGGSSSINAMVYSRGSPADYDEWAQRHGCVGWSWAELFPHFRKLQRHSDRHDAAHGRHGELAVSDQSEVNPLSTAFLEACAELGLPPAGDLASSSAAGAGLLQHTVRRGQRWSAARSFLHPVAGRRNLEVRTDAPALRLIVKGARVRGVVLGGRAGLEHVLADEVIVCAGAVGTPKLLLLSGIGPAAELTALGIRPVLDQQGIGRGLADHLHLPLVAGCTAPVSLDRRRAAWRLPMDALRYGVMGRGLLATRVLQAAAYVALDPAGPVPDIALHFIPIRLADARGAFGDGPGMTIHAALLRPKSSGSVRLASADPSVPALVDPGYLSDRGDLAGAVRCFAWAQDVLRSRAMAPWIERPLLPPRPLERPDEVAAFVRANADTDYHLAASCRMGAQPLDPVDPADLRLRGLAGIRVCDTSILPTLVRGNTNAVVMAIAARAAEIITGTDGVRPAGGVTGTAEPRLAERHREVASAA